MPKDSPALSNKEIDGLKDPQKRPNARRLILVLGGVAAALAVLALALGLGLGLGLKRGKNDNSKPAPPTSTSTSAPIANTTIEPWRRATEDYNLDMSWDLNAPPTTRTYDFTVGEIQAAPDGVLRTLLVINGQFPGPLIRANRGDRLMINVTNALANATSLHWHGLYQNGTNYMDGTVGVTQCPIPPGHSFLYNFTVENQYGTHWYHSHFSTQYADGLVGPLVVHAPEEAEAQKGYEHDQIILLSDWYHDLTAALLPAYLAPGNENNEPVPDNGLIQGTNTIKCSSLGTESGYTCLGNSSQAVFNVAKGKSYRYRLINTGAFAEYQFSIDNHTLSVIEADGTMVEPLGVHRLDINIAQRYSFILTADQALDNYWIRAEMNTNCFTTANDVLNPDVRAVLSYSNTSTVPDATSVDWADALEQTCTDLNSTQLIPTEVEAAPTADVVYALEISFQIGADELDVARINSTSWQQPTIPTLNQALAGLHSSNSTAASAFNVAGLSNAYDQSTQLVLSVPTTQVVDLIITNLDDGAHPFHLHGHKFWIIAQSHPPMTTGGYFPWSEYGAFNTTNPLRRDTMTIDAYGWAYIRFRADNPGMWAMHCHIVWHMEAGMLFQFQSRSDMLRTWTLSEDVSGLCHV
ncbi:MAG: hypothetical protein M1818_000571 [Claussenomyces sp. TS43310]|nr:MAG: hypothetical protein M1818_000571 [Claussenomyces sp. TS43310]